MLSRTALTEERPFTSVRAIRALSPQAASQALPVVLHGVVAVHSGWRNSFFFYDGSYGISVNRSTVDPVLHDGQRITIHGVTAPGSFAPIVQANAIAVDGSAPAPKSRVFTPEELVGGQQDSQWVALRGTVRSQEVRSIWGREVLTFNLDIGSGVVVAARILNFDRAHPPLLAGAYIQISGICGTLFNDRRQFMGIRLFSTSPASIQVLRPAPKDPFDRPVRPLDALLQFRNNSHAHEFIRVSGTVTWNKPGSAFYLQSLDRGLFVEWKDGETPAIGSSVEAVGFPTEGHGSTRLEAAFVRQVPNGVAVHPIAIAANQVISNHEGFIRTPTESLLVDIEGRLVNSVVGTQFTTLLLEENSTLFSVRVPAKQAEFLEAGSTLRVRGICAIDYDDYTNEPNSFSVQIRSAADVVVLHPAPWWNVHHAMIVAEILAFLVAALLALILLSRQATLRSLASTDSLTGLCNRRTLLRAIEANRRSSRRGGSALQLVFIDVDHFKQINDRYGHRQGDVALKRVATLLRQTFPESRAIGRIGGDEFVVLLQQNSGDGCSSRLVAALERSNRAGPDTIPLSLSIGIVQCRSDERNITAEDLLERADIGMYEQKALRKAQALDGGAAALAPV